MLFNWFYISSQYYLTGIYGEHRCDLIERNPSPSLNHGGVKSLHVRPRVNIIFQRISNVDDAIKSRSSFIEIVNRCSQLNAPANGSLEQCSNLAGQTCKFYCDKGYHLNGSTTRTCSSNATWSGTQPLCNRECWPLHFTLCK